MKTTEDSGGWLVIFDCDGVLVDSEPIALSVLLEMLATEGIELDMDGVSERYLGRSFGTVIGLVREEFALKIDEDFASRMRQRLFDRFERELKPMAGMDAALDGLSLAGIEFCVASSSLPDRIFKSLSVVGLLERFAGGIFSSTMVERGKPAPDLFLYAATSLGYSPERCIVVEDSAAGIRAAKAAGMHVLAFTGGSHTATASYIASIDGLEPDAQFDAMANLLQLVERVRRSEDGLNA